MKKVIISMVLLLVAGVSASAETLQIEGSTTVGPIADAFAEYFKTVYPDLQVTVNQTGSGDGATALIDGRCDIADMSRFMKPDEFGKAVAKGVMPVAHVVAMDGVCVALHPSNPVAALTRDQIRDIYSGEITNWSQVGGVSRDIIPISRDSSSGTYETFENIVMRGAVMADNVEYVSTNPQMQGRVRTTEGAIGYLGLGFVDSSVKAVKVDQVLPTRQTIANGTYPIARPLFMFTNGYPKLGSMLYKFCTFYLSERGQDLIEAKEFVPLTDY
jgi:phosphate transport system substrate-binding protein